MNVLEDLLQLQNSSDHDSDSDSELDRVLSEESLSSCTDGCLEQEMTDLISKDGQFNFSTSPPSKSGRPMNQNKVTETQGIPTTISKRIFSPLTAFEQFITADIVKIVLDSTNYFLTTRTSESYRLSCSDFWLYLGSLFYLGVMKSKNSSSEDMWDKDKGIPYLSSCRFLY